MSIRSRLRFRYDYVLYQKWYRFYVLGMFRFIKYLAAPYHGETKKRILGIENFSTNSPALGNLLEFQMRWLCLADLEGADAIDIAFVYDLKTPFWDKKMSRWLKPSNFPFHLYSILPLLNINPKLGSVFIFNSRENFEDFLAKHRQEYMLSPTLFHYVNGSSAGRGNYRFVRDFYLKKKYLPQFVFREGSIRWAKAFMAKHAAGKYAVTVNLRMNRFFGGSRNSDLSSWKHLLDYCNDKHSDVIFFILARRQEAPEEFQHLSNVVFIKDAQTTMEQDMCLVRHGLFHMGVVSGPASFVYYEKDLPYAIFRFELPDRANNYRWLKPGSSFPWQNTATQHIHWGEETRELLVHEFEHLYQCADKSAWMALQQNADTSVLDWPHLTHEELIHF